MKTFDEIKESVIKESYRRLKASTEWFESKESPTPEEQKAYDDRKAEVARDIQFVDDAATFEIGRCTNRIIEGLKDTCNVDGNAYFNNYEKIISDVLFKTNAAEEILPPQYYARIKSECDFLGITPNDLMCLKGMNPNNADLENTLKSMVNQSMGTTIPMAEEVETAKEEYSEAIDSMDEVETAKKLIKYAELLHNSGSKYKYLGINKEYLNAKEQVVGKNVK